SYASSSIVALSVSTSAMMSPIAIVSPGCFSHCSTLPSSIVSESFGIVTSIGMAVCASAPARGHGGSRRRGLAPEDAVHDADDALDGRQHAGLEPPGVRHRDVEVGDALGRRVEL